MAKLSVYGTHPTTQDNTGQQKHEGPHVLFFAGNPASVVYCTEPSWRNDALETPHSRADLSLVSLGNELGVSTRLFGRRMGEPPVPQRPTDCSIKVGLWCNTDPYDV